MNKRHELTSGQYNSIKHLLPGQPGVAGPNVDNHKFLNGVFCYLKTGIPWRDLPQRYGHWKTVHRRFSRWCKAGVFQKIFMTLSQHYAKIFETIQLDSSIVKGRQHACGALKKKPL